MKKKKVASLTHSEKRIRARASLRRIKLSICLGVAVMTCQYNNKLQSDTEKYKSLSLSPHHYNMSCNLKNARPKTNIEKTGNKVHNQIF